MEHEISAGDTGALWDWMNSEDSTHDSLRMSRAYQKGGYELLAKAMNQLPILGDWTEEQLLDALGDMEAMDLLSAHFGMTESKKNISKKTLNQLIAEAVRKGLANAIKERKPSRVKISSAQLAEGIRKAVKKVLLSENTMASPGRAGSGRMAGGAMPPPGKGAVAGTAAPTQEGVSDGDKVRGRSSFGQIPSPEELQQAIDDLGGWDMDLKGADSLAFDFAMMVADARYPNMNTGEGMHKVLTALANCPEPDALPDNVDQEELDDPDSRLNRLLDAWDARYDNESIAQTAEALASSIMDVLGWEWI